MESWFRVEFGELRVEIFSVESGLKTAVEFIPQPAGVFSYQISMLPISPFLPTQ